MLNAFQIVALVFLYICMILALIYVGHRGAVSGRILRWKPYIYALSLGIYVTSWSYLGAIRIIRETGWDLLSMYLGPIIAFLVGFPVLEKIIRVTKSQNITSVADFVATRYGKKQSLATLVAILATFPLLPYLASQIGGVATSINLMLLPPEYVSGAIPHTAYSEIISLVLVLSMVGCAVLLGTRSADLTRQNWGMVSAIAAESVVKALTFVAMAVYAFWVWQGHFSLDMMGQARLADFFEGGSDGSFSDLFITYFIISVLAVFCLPRQFHITMIEAGGTANIGVSRWLFPLFIGVIALSTVVIVMSSDALGRNLGLPPEIFFLGLPIAQGNGAMAIAGFIGILSASFGMVIVLVLAYTTMISNDLVIPALMKIGQFKADRPFEISRLIFPLRTSIITVVMALGYLMHKYGARLWTENVDLVTFVSVINLAPAIIGGLYWRRAHRHGVMAGLIAGYLCWFFLLLVPGLENANLYLSDAASVSRAPDLWFSLPGVSGLTSGVLISLAANLFCFWSFSLAVRPGLQDQMQAGIFVDGSDAAFRSRASHTVLEPQIIEDLKLLLGKFLGPAFDEVSFQSLSEKADSSDEGRDYGGQLLNYAESELTKILGGAVARNLIQSTLEGRRLRVSDIVTIFDQKSEEDKFNRLLLNNILANIRQGVCVIDEGLKVVAWNRQLVEMLSVMPEKMHVGMSVRALFSQMERPADGADGKVPLSPDERITLLKRRDPRCFAFDLPNGLVLKSDANVMPTGELIVSLTDITELKRVERQLKDANESLEQRVADRTAALLDANRKLDQAKAKAEEATRAKSRFLAAASHDLLQPLNAARLFTSSLEQKSKDGTSPDAAILGNIYQSLNAADSLIEALLDISKLDSGLLKPDRRIFPIGDLLASLAAEFSIVAERKGLALRVVRSSLWVESDKGLLLSVLQNILSNAVRYTALGKILLGCRRTGDFVCVEIWDTGAGIPLDKQKEIFKEFYRIDNGSTASTESDLGGTNLGLGLAIADRIARLLGSEIKLESEVGRGSTFRVFVPLSAVHDPVSRSTDTPRKARSQLRNLQIFYLDPEHESVSDIPKLLRHWGCNVIHVETKKEAFDRLAQPANLCHVLLIPWHIKQAGDGLELIRALRESACANAVGILLVRAEDRESVNPEHLDGCQVLSSPVQPAALRAVLQRVKRR